MKVSHVMNIKWLLGVIFFIVILVSLAFVLQPTLPTIHKQIVADYHNVKHINGDQLLSLNSNDVILFDVREPDEFAVSHIQGAIQVAPQISVEDFMQQYGASLQGKMPIFYCSVGRRSSALASRLATALEDSGAQPVHNLIGGAFQWHNESRPLANGNNQQTTLIHPYNKYWGRLINNHSATRYSATQ